ncbi:MAG: hypothetical protein ACOYK1_05125 [Vampirovibrionia bacterium]
MIKKHFALKKDIEIFSGLSLKEISLGILFLGLYLYLIQLLAIQIDSPLAIWILSSFTFLWICYRSTKLNLSENSFFIKHISSPLLFNKSVLKLHFLPLSQKVKSYSKRYRIKKLINYSTASKLEIDQLNHLWQKLLENILEFRNSKTKIKFRIFINAENIQEVNPAKERASQYEEKIFHPCRFLEIEVNSNSEKTLQQINYHLELFSVANKIDLEIISEKEDDWTDFKERINYIKTSEYIKCLSLKDIELENASFESLNNFLKSLSCTSEFCIILQERNLNRDKSIISHKVNFLQSFTRAALSNKSHLDSLKSLYHEIYDNSFIADLQIILKLYSPNKEMLEKNLLKISTSQSLLSFNEAKYLQRELYTEKIQDLPFLITAKDLNYLNPFLEDRTCMENGALIGYKLDDKSLVYFTPENTQFCNNKSINFIGDSGSGKSLAVKLLIKKFNHEDDDENTEIKDCKQSPNSTVAERASSRLRRTNDRNVRVISSDAKDASHVSGSYPSKQKYKLDLSSLHEDHEDDENAEIGVRQQCSNAKFVILDSTLLGWEFFTAYMGGEIYNSPESFKNLVLFKKNISLVNFHSIEKNKALTNLCLENIFMQIENAVRELDSTIYLVIDEAWKLIYEEENPLSKKLISKLARTGRAMNLGLWTISQKPSDLTRDIHSSAASSFIFQCKENTDKAELGSHLNLNERELKLLESQEIKDRGTALLKTSKFSGLIKFKADEDELILTNSSAEVVRERQLIFNEIKAANLKDSSHASFLDNMAIARQTLEKMQEKNIWS